MSLPAPAADRTSIVTGASSGIGEQIAHQLARRGHGLVLVARREERLRQLAGELRRPGIRVEVLGADLSDRSARAGLLQRVGDLGLTPHILVNNAGFSTLGKVAESDPARELNMVEVDVAAVADLCSRFLPGMVERRRGAILNVASTAAFQPIPGQAAYAACKAFVLSYSRALVGELHGTGVTVTALCPGPVQTGFEEVAGFGEGEAEAALPRFMWESAESVARAGVDGLDRGRPVVIPGAANRAGAMLAHLAPKRFIVALLASRHPGVRSTS